METSLSIQDEILRLESLIANFADWANPDEYTWLSAKLQETKAELKKND